MSKLETKPPEFDAQPCAMRFIGVLRPEGACKEGASRHVRRPRFAQRTDECKQNRPCCERDHGVAIAYDVAARVHDEHSRGQQRFNLVQQEQPFLARRNQTCSRRVHENGNVFDFRRQRGDARTTCGMPGIVECYARLLRIQAPNREPRYHELVGGPQGVRQACGIDLRQAAFGFVEPTDQHKTPNSKKARVSRIRPIAVPLEHSARRIKRPGGKTQIARDKSNLGLGNNTTRAS